MSQGSYRLCFWAGLALLGSGWLLALVVAVRVEGHPPSLWLQDDWEVEEARRTGDLAGASDHERVRGVLLARPDLVRDAANLARSAEDPERGIAALRSLTRLEPRNPNVRWQLAAAQMQAGRRADAAETLRALLRIAPDHPRAKQALERIERRIEGPT